MCTLQSDRSGDTLDLICFKSTVKYNIWVSDGQKSAFYQKQYLLWKHLTLYHIVSQLILYRLFHHLLKTLNSHVQTNQIQLHKKSHWTGSATIDRHRIHADPLCDFTLNFIAFQLWICFENNLFLFHYVLCRAKGLNIFEFWCEQNLQHP